MQFRVILLLYFVHRVWCETIINTQNSSEIVILDTNVCIITLKLFDTLIEEIQLRKPAERKPTYDEIWTLLKEPELVDKVANEYLTKVDKIKLKSAVDITKHVLNLKVSRPNVEFLVPVFVYHEAVNGITPKISKAIGILKFPEYVDFLKSMPIKTTIETHDLTEGIDYPRKNVSINETLSTMKDFLSNSIKSNRNLENLFKYLNENTAVKRIQTERKLRDLIRTSVNVGKKIKLWDAQMKVILSNNGVKDYSTESKQFAKILGKIASFSLNKINFESVIDVIAYRLIKFKEEFDYFDLQIYLLAKEKDAFMLTVNTQAIQEVNDPVFLGFFENVKILNPNINFKYTNDLDKPSNCKTLMETAILMDFENDEKILSKLKSIVNLHRESLNINLLKPMFHHFFSEIKQELNNGRDLTSGYTLFFNALNLLKEVDARAKIDQKILFSTSITKKITKQINALNYIDKYIFNSTLSINDIIKSAPIIDFVPKFPIFGKDLAESIQNGLQNENHSLTEFLKIFRIENNSTRLKAIQYAKMLYY